MASRDFFRISDVPGETDDRFHWGWFDALTWEQGPSSLYVVLPFQPATAKLHVAGKMKQMFKIAILHVTEGDRVFQQMNFYDLRISRSQSLGRVDGRLAEAFHFEHGVTSGWGGSGP